MRRLILVLIVVLASITLLATWAGAQTLSLDVEKGTIPGLGTEAVLPYELDGDPATREFVQWKVDVWTNRILIRSITTASGICKSEWFSPFDYANLRPLDFFASGAIMRAGDRDKFIYTGLQSYGEVDLMPTRCQQ